MLTPAGGRLKVNAPAGAITQTLRAGLAEEKAAILILLASPRFRVEEAARKLGLPVAEVLAQFNRWQYTPADIAEASGWSNAVIDDHACLLAGEVVEDRHRDAWLMDLINEPARIVDSKGAFETRGRPLR
jgi:hypothetical protein